MSNFVLDDKKNLVEAYSKEEVMAVLQQAIEDGSLAGIDPESAFVSKLKCCVSGITNQVAFVTTAKYAELKANNQLIANCYYFITDDDTAETIEAHYEKLDEDFGKATEQFASLLTQKADKPYYYSIDNTSWNKFTNIEFFVSRVGHTLRVVIPSGCAFTAKLNGTGDTLNKYFNGTYQEIIAQVSQNGSDIVLRTKVPNSTWENTDYLDLYSFVNNTYGIQIMFIDTGIVSGGGTSGTNENYRQTN